MTDKKKARRRGIWCLETVWYQPENNLSVRPILELMNALYGTPFVHRNAVSKEEFWFFVEAWLNAEEEDEEFPILVLSYHGSQGTVSLREDHDIDWNDKDTWNESVVTLDEISRRLEDRCENRVIHFSSCSSLDVTHSDISDLVDKTGASAVSGYTKEVDWIEAMSFELIYMKRIQEAPHINLTPRIMWDVDEELRTKLEDVVPYLDEDEGFLPIRDMGRGLGFNLRVRVKPA